jgi:predicted RNase H-like HicB family nuclease
VAGRWHAGYLDERPHVISRYIAEALHRAQYRIVDGGLFCGTVAGLPGVIATGKTLEACRDQLVEVIEEWLLLRVAQGLKIPRLGTVTVQIKRAS